ncbi:hypothetical protein M0654_08680 [Rhizobium sp. NTR19]|uniref:MarR family transcriptional regulator n=1 Tax=Neorhizobium turbinariae TaxID=2937795 RepID=A0ABT0IQA5_9HYPH|nr:hypothetical protein [Neorhizobium turbinariae]MCK8780056.1 hypothetical protein [Neorhizobium turbinariae]
MIRNFDEIQNSTKFLSLIKIQSEKFLGIHEEKPRLATVFSSQDRWLMAHVGLALHFEKIIGARHHGLSAASFVRSVTDHNVTSRNTAIAFLNEMLNYGIIDHRPHPTDRRMRIMVPASTAVEAIIGWTSLHLATLDALDGGDRTSWFHASPLTAISELQPAIAAGLLRDKTIRNPPQAFAHFMWMNSGFLITERLIASLEDCERLSERLPLRVTSAAVLTSGLNLSRSHSARKINEAERLGILGWSGTKGRSPMWLSREFVSSFCSVQAAKLEIIDQAVTRVQATPIHQIDRPQAERQPSPLN